MICINCKNETTHTKNDLCLDCYFKIHSPTKTIETPWIFQQVPLRFDRIRTTGEKLFDSEIADRIIKGQYSIDKDKNQLQIVDYSFPYTLEGLDKVALKAGILVGKWLIYRSEETIDSVWKKVAFSVMKRRLGSSAKVSTVKQRSKSYVICVYTDDYLVYDDVRRVREELFSLGFEESLCYKPDLYTYLNIYSGTSSIKPCRYRI